jgi:nitroreductase
MPNDLAFAIANRRSMGLSKLKPDPVPRKLIEEMLIAANWAPSHGDTEPWRFIVYSGEGRHQLAKNFAVATQEDAALKRAFAAPVWIALGMEPKKNEDGSLVMSEEEELMAATCAVQNLHLTASALGLAGMWHSKGVSVNPLVAKALGWEAPSRLLGFFMCGWPSVDWPEGERGQWQDKVVWVDN